ncbi:MAG: mercury transporter [Clostridia bacterium]
MDTVYEIISLLRIVIIPIGVTFRVIYCLIKMMYDEEAVGSYKKKIKNTIIFGIIAELTFVIKDLIVNYYN